MEQYFRVLDITDEALKVDMACLYLEDTVMYDRGEDKGTSKEAPALEALGLSSRANSKSSFILAMLKKSPGVS